MPYIGTMTIPFGQVVYFDEYLELQKDPEGKEPDKLVGRNDFHPELGKIIGASPSGTVLIRTIDLTHQNEKGPIPSKTYEVVVGHFWPAYYDMQIGQWSSWPLTETYKQSCCSEEPCSAEVTD